MKKLIELRRKRAAKMEELRALAGQDLTDEVRSKFDAAEAEVKSLDADIARLERAQELERSQAQDALDELDDDSAPEPQQRARVTDPQANDLFFQFGALVRSVASYHAARQDGVVGTLQRAAQVLYGDRHPVIDAITDSQKRAQTLGGASSGGLLVPPRMAATVIERFTPDTIVRRAATVVPGNAAYPKGLTGASVGYVGENEQGRVTGVSFGLIDMTEKDISAILPISKKLLRNITFGLESYCSTELARAAGLFEDEMFLYGDGVGKRVRGYYHSTPMANRINATVTTEPTAAQVRADIRKVILKLITANVPLMGAEWWMHGRVLEYLRDVYQGDQLAFPTLQGNNPTLRGFPVRTTTNIRSNGGGTNDESTIFFGAHQHALIGDTVAMTLSTSDQASYVDERGQQVNMWAQNMLAVKLDMSHDLKFRHDEAFAYLDKVRWGA